MYMYIGAAIAEFTQNVVEMHSLLVVFRFKTHENEMDQIQQY